MTSNYSEKQMHQMLERYPCGTFGYTKSLWLHTKHPTFLLANNRAMYNNEVYLHEEPVVLKQYVDNSSTQTLPHCGTAEYLNALCSGTTYSNNLH